MKVRSTLFHDPVWIRCVEPNGEAKVVLRQNTAQKVDESDMKRFYYEWDEVEVTLVNRDNLLGYVQENFDELFDFGCAEEQKPKPKTLKEVRDEQIENLQKQNLKITDMNTALYEANIEIAEFVVGLYEMIAGGGE